MNKKVTTITITSMLLLTTLVGCSSNKIEREKTIETQSESTDIQKEKFIDYKIEEKEYINKDMKIKYPQISGLEDEKKQEIINNLIKTKAISIYDETLKELEKEQIYEVDGTYEIKLKDNKILSIAYTSYNNVTPSAYPYSLFYTTNIDIKTGQELALKEIIPKVDDDFIKLLKQGKYVGPVEKEYQEQLMKFVYSN
ncbi:MAG: DUF4163 domain-containing protein, partial [Fusobacteriaceae bacterium]